MEPAAITAVPPEVVEQVRVHPARFLLAAEEAEPGWADAYGGPVGVAQLAAALLEDTAHTARSVAALRTAVINYMRTHEHRTLATIGADLHVSPQAVRKLEVKDSGAYDERYAALRNPAAWRTSPAAERS